MSDEAGQGSPPPPERLFQQYSGGAGVFDELREDAATARPHWRPFIESLERLGPGELTARGESSRRLLREHGVTYNVYGDPKGTDRAWGLDLLPLVISAEEWARLEAGLIQRSRLFNLVLADIYDGSQRLLRDGLLPAELVYANPGFLRPCRGIPVRSQVYVHLQACDLGRSPDGQWWVLSDRTQAPSGAGYTWENRTVLSRVLPDEIRECSVERLGGFFRRQREMLFSLAPPGCEQPTVVLLTPGPHNETYFEQAYLARHLGFALVEGADLTVRDRRVFLKTIEGLQPVEVILRRVDDSFCDPLELRSDSFLGVSGLVEAARAGNVTVANALGAGFIESPAFLAFLPSLCQHLLGEELSLPSLATWWCGQPRELEYVLEHLDQLNLRPAFGGRGPQPLPPGLAAHRRTAEQRKHLGRLLQATPGDFVAQERMKLSQAPVWSEGRLAAGSVLVRTFVASGADAAAVMPGGLARLSTGAEDVAVSMQSGGFSKDTWVLSNGSTRAELAASPPDPMQPVRPGAGVPSRAADHLFWLGRYTERLEQLLRVLRCIVGRLSGESGADSSLELSTLAVFATGLKLFPGAAATDLPGEELAERTLRALYAPDERGGVRELLARIRATAAAVRDRFSADMWRILSRLEADGRSRRTRLPLAGATALLHKLVLDLSAFGGMEMENMTRGYGWRFLDFGRRLERGVCVVDLLSATANMREGSGALLEPVLEIADSIMTYRRRHFAAPSWPGAAELLLREQTNPRSLAFQIEALREHACALPGATAEMELFEQLAAALRTADLCELAAQCGQGKCQPLQVFLGTCGTKLGALSDELTNRYFSHTALRVNER